MKISVSIVDDHNIVVSGLQSMLAGYPQIQILNTYNSALSFLASLNKERPDILLLDINLPDIGGEELIDIIRKKNPSIKILVVSGFDTTYYVKTMLQKGAKGYILKNTDCTTLIKAIEDIHIGNEFVEPILKDQLLQDLVKTKREISSLLPLSKREKDILLLITQEYTSQEMAAKLYISIRTVDNYRNILLQKLKAKNTAGLVKVALRLGLVN